MTINDTWGIEVKVIFSCKYLGVTNNKLDWKNHMEAGYSKRQRLRPFHSCCAVWTIRWWPVLCLSFGLLGGRRPHSRQEQGKLIKKALWSRLNLKQFSTVVAERRMLLKLTWPRHAQEVITSSTFSQSAPGGPLNRPLYSSCLMHNNMIFDHISIFQMCWLFYLLLLSVYLKSHKKIITFSHHFPFIKSIYIRFWST